MKINLYPNLNLGTVELVNRNTIIVNKDTFAPGIWAGSEGIEVNIHTWADEYKGSTKVISIDLDNRIVELQDASFVQCGDIIRME